MKKILRLLVPILYTLYLILYTPITPAHAQDEPNANITKRRPDRPPAYSPSPSPVGVDPRVDPKTAEVKQIETSDQSFIAKLWNQIKSFFVNLFKQPEASTTSVPTTP